VCGVRLLHTANWQPSVSVGGAAEHPSAAPAAAAADAQAESSLQEGRSNQSVAAVGISGHHRSLKNSKPTAVTLSDVTCNPVSPWSLLM
jgi:hypothetical protein